MTNSPSHSFHTRVSCDDATNAASVGTTAGLASADDGKQLKRDAAVGAAVKATGKLVASKGSEVVELVADTVRPCMHSVMSCPCSVVLP